MNYDDHIVYAIILSVGSAAMFIAAYIRMVFPPQVKKVYVSNSPWYGVRERDRKSHEFRIRLVGCYLLFALLLFSFFLMFYLCLK